MTACYSAFVLPVVGPFLVLFFSAALAASILGSFWCVSEALQMARMKTSFFCCDCSSRFQRRLAFLKRPLCCSWEWYRLVHRPAWGSARREAAVLVQACSGRGRKGTAATPAKATKHTQSSSVSRKDCALFRCRSALFWCRVSPFLVQLLLLELPVLRRHLLLPPSAPSGGWYLFSASTGCSIGRHRVFVWVSFCFCHLQRRH